MPSCPPWAGRLASTWPRTWPRCVRCLGYACACVSGRGGGGCTRALPLAQQDYMRCMSAGHLVANVLSLPMLMGSQQAQASSTSAAERM